MSAPTIIPGDCLAMLPLLPEASVDSVVTDPPYDLGFMGKSWDATGIAFDPETWQAVLRVLKPGGHLIAFGGTRTWHRMVSAIEDAGFEVRDSIAWLYGSGFPKSLDVSKAIDKAAGAERSAREWAGWGTALKPAFEPIVVARKPFKGTVASNVLAHGTGALNIDACRIGFASLEDEVESKHKNRHADFGSGSGAKNTYGDYSTTEVRNYDPPGRWPANVILDESQAAVLDEQSGASVSRIGKPRGAESGAGWGMTATGSEYADSGGASRFFYCAKAPSRERPKVDGTAHPTVKPLTLMRWLVRLVTPPGGTVLDPFLGSGTTAEAALLEGFSCIGMEREQRYVDLVRARLSKHEVAS